MREGLPSCRGFCQSLSQAIELPSPMENTLYHLACFLLHAGFSSPGHTQLPEMLLSFEFFNLAFAPDVHFPVSHIPFFSNRLLPSPTFLPSIAPISHLSPINWIHNFLLIAILHAPAPYLLLLVGSTQLGSKLMRVAKMQSCIVSRLSLPF